MHNFHGNSFVATNWHEEIKMAATFFQENSPNSYHFYTDLILTELFTERHSLQTKNIRLSTLLESSERSFYPITPTVNYRDT